MLGFVAGGWLGERCCAASRLCGWQVGVHQCRVLRFSKQHRGALQHHSRGVRKKAHEPAGVKASE